MKFYTVKLEDDSIKTMWAKNKKDLLHKLITEYPNEKCFGLLAPNKSYWKILWK